MDLRWCRPDATRFGDGRGTAAVRRPSRSGGAIIGLTSFGVFTASAISEFIADPAIDDGFVAGTFIVALCLPVIEACTAKRETRTAPPEHAASPLPRNVLDWLATQDPLVRRWYEDQLAIILARTPSEHARWLASLTPKIRAVYECELVRVRHDRDGVIGSEPAPGSQR